MHKRMYKPRAGGVSPPWFANATAPAFVSIAQAVSRDFAEAPLQVRYSNPRRADARRSLVDARLCIAKIVFCRQTFAMQHKSGGRQPPVVIINGERNGDAHIHRRQSAERSRLCLRNEFLARTAG